MSWLNSFYGAAKDRAVIEVLRARQHSIIFNNRSFVEPVKSPESYEGLNGFSLEHIYSKPAVRIGLWHKQAEDKDKPVYVMFHGRTGHWADTGKKPGRVVDRDYRVKWLKAAADSGAEVIAVHLRGYGASKRDGVQSTEEGFKLDVQAVADYLQKRKIPCEKVIVAGESLGGAAAGMLAEEMTKRGHPPAVLGLIACPASMAEYVHDKYAHLNTRHVISALRFRMDSKKRLHSLEKDATSLYLAYAPADANVPHRHAGLMEKTAQEQGLSIFTRELHGDWLKPSQEVHMAWKPERIVQDLESLFARDRDKRHAGLQIIRQRRAHEFSYDDFPGG